MIGTMSQKPRKATRTKQPYALKIVERVTDIKHATFTWPPMRSRGGYFKPTFSPNAGGYYPTSNITTNYFPR